MSLLSIPSSADSASAASVNTSEIFCCFSTSIGLPFFGGFLSFFSWTKQNLVRIDPGFKLAREELGFLWSIQQLKWSPHILSSAHSLACLFAVFSRAIWIGTLCFEVVSDARTFWLPCLENLYSLRQYSTPVRHCNKKRQRNHNYWLFLLDRTQTTRSDHHQASLSWNQKSLWRHHA